MNSTKIDPKYISKSNPRVGLIALASDFMIERDFINVIKDREVDFFVNRIECYNPLTKENLIKMSNKVTEVTKDILPDQDIDCVVYGCTSGTIAAGYESIEKKVKAAKPMAEVTTPSTAAIKALKKLNINKISLFTPYSKKLNDEVLEYFKSEGFEITSNSYFDIEADYDIGKVDQNYLYDVLSKLDLNGADALFVSCTAKYQKAYFEKFDNVWHHSDYIEHTKHNGFIMHGRSDSTLKPGGVRIGTSEIYRQVENIDFVTEGLVVGQRWKNDERIILFVTTKNNADLDEEKIQHIKKIIRERCSPKHVPAKIIKVPEIPRTKSGKIVELAVKNVINGIKVNNIESLSNPESLKFFENILELKY